MPSALTRRQFLRSAGRGLFAAVDALATAPMPLFTALPYIQPGPEGRLVPGGQSLHDAEMTNAPQKWPHAEDGSIAYCRRLVADRHSFSLFEIDGGELTLRQIDEHGLEFDRMRVTKA